MIFMRHLFYIVAFFSVMVGGTLPSYAQDSADFDAVASGYEPVFMPKLEGNSVVLDFDEVPPREPNIIKVKFLKIPPVSGLSERVDRLVWGIKTDITPEHDHYGHEIRRYMAKVGNLRVFDEDEFLIEQIKNVRKAKVISNFWRKMIEEESEKIEARFEEEGESLPFAVRTAFRQNMAATRTFLIILSSWIDANERFLMSIFDMRQYTLDYPEISIVKEDERIEFFNALNARQTKLKELKDYKTFSMMVY